MKYEDTILKTDEIDHIIKTSPNLYDNFTMNKILDVCKKQAELSFNAGIKEVVDFLNITPYPLSGYFGSRAYEKWQAKLKEWGIVK